MVSNKSILIAFGSIKIGSFLDIFSDFYMKLGGFSKNSDGAIFFFLLRSSLYKSLCLWVSGTSPGGNSGITSFYSLTGVAGPG